MPAQPEPSAAAAETSTPDVAANLQAVQARVAAAAREAGREASEVGLVAISKTQGPERIRPALLAGHRLFGENRVQESEGKWPELKAAFPDAKLHLVGPLQSNKVRQAMHLFDVIETVDRPKLARRLAQMMAETGLRPDCFIEVNTGGEAQKAGIQPADCDDFVRLCRDELDLPIAGLMCIPPFEDEPSPHFELLKKLAERNGLKGISMGMSADFETAIAFGATLVRVGTAIFGPRQPY